VQLRAQEDERHSAGGGGTAGINGGGLPPRADTEFWEDDFPGLKG
jgi:hypothetical protein